PIKLSLKKARIDSLRKIVDGFPVIVNMKDTLFVVHSNIGESTPKERASHITKKIKKLQDDDFLKIDSILVVKSENTFDIVYGETVIIKISVADAIWYDKSTIDLANELSAKIKDSIIENKKENALLKRIQRLGLVLLVLGFVWLIIWLIKRGNARLLRYINKNQDKWLKKISYKDYTFLTKDMVMRINLSLLKFLRWFLYALLFYISLPIIFSISPLTRNWSHKLFQLIWTPLKGVSHAVWEYLPNLFTILIIYFVMKYFIRLVKFIFSEIETENLKIPGFYNDWAMPTFSIVKILLYAFMLILIFPYLPGSDSDVFKGVSIFIGVLFSLGSSSAVANMIAGLMITYMRPFKIGDRIQIAGVKGDVIEKTLLVTRLRTPKNEIITIPNSSVLSGNTINYTIETHETGLIIYTTVTIGYDVPWKDIHQALIDAALKTDMILQEPKPFVRQTSLGDFYVSYQINAYTKEASKQARLYSDLHQNIQDVCNERGIEILSPHYRAERDGNMTTIPNKYLSKDYKAPSFKVKLEKDETN
ncbi:MAG: mechanosensitive ion channel family protein, partial [Aureibaculum sp.]|nr:mechanosensitive ion channel family protein [Aureibaculum sp.]